MTVAQALMEWMGKAEFVQWQTLNRPTYTEMRAKLAELKTAAAMKVKNDEPRWTRAELER